MTVNLKTGDKPAFHKILSFWDYLLVFFLFSLSLFLLLFYLKGIGSSLMHKGIKSFHKKDFVQAQKYFEQSLAKNPSDPWSYMNLALNHDLLNEPDKALKNYDIVSSHLVKKSNLAVFFSYFNKGKLYGQLGQLEKALNSYQEALEFRYKEKETKTNIELLFKNDKSSEKNKKQEENQKNQSEDKEEKDKGQSERDKEKVDKNQSANQQKQKNKNQEKDKESTDTDKENPKNQKSQSENTEKDQGSSKGEEDLKGLSEKEQKAILEEIEKQENKVRARFYKGQTIFGDKTKRDW